MDYGVQFAVERSSFCNCSLGWKICLLLQDSWELFFGCILQSLLRAVGRSAPQRIQTQMSGRAGTSLGFVQTNEFHIILMAEEHRVLLPSASPLHLHPTLHGGTQPWPCSPRRELVGHPGVLSTSWVLVSPVASGCCAVGVSCDGRTPVVPHAGSFSSCRKGLRERTRE